MVYIPAYSAPDKTGVMFWSEIAFCLVNTFYAINLHFYIDLVFKKKIKKWGMILIYIPSVLISMQFIISPYTILDYVNYNGQWKLIPAYGDIRFLYCFRLCFNFCFDYSFCFSFISEQGGFY